MHIRCIGTPDRSTVEKVKAACRWYVDHLVHPKLADHIEITINFNKIKGDDDNLGLCEAYGTNYRYRRFNVHLYRRMSQKRLLTILAHEIVHVKQYAHDELRDISSKPDYLKWYGKAHRQVDSPWKSYAKLPWEKEALRLESRLYMKFKESEGASVS